MTQSIQSRVTVDENGDVEFIHQETPSDLKDVLTDAITSGKFNPDVKEVSLENIGPGIDIGTVTVDPETETVTTCIILDSILEDHATFE